MPELIIAGYSDRAGTTSWIVSGIAEYSPQQPRDRYGRWSRVGGVSLSHTYTPDQFSPMSKSDMAFAGLKKPHLRLVESGRPGSSLIEGSLAMSPGDLPQLLYHVTVNAEAVQESGKLLAQSDAGGLGGGIMAGVSLTKSRSIADNIALHLSRASSLVRDAKTVEDAKKLVNGWARADEDDLGLERGALQRPVDNMFEWYAFQEKHYPRKNGEGINTSTMLEAYTHALLSFEMDGGRQDPIVFGARADKYATISPSDISVIEIPAADVFESGGAVVDRDDFLQEVRVYGDIPVANSSFSIVDDRRMGGDVLPHEIPRAYAVTQDEVESLMHDQQTKILDPPALINPSSLRQIVSTAGADPTNFYLAAVYDPDTGAIVTPGSENSQSGTRVEHVELIRNLSRSRDALFNIMDRSVRFTISYAPETEDSLLVYFDGNTSGVVIEYDRGAWLPKSSPANSDAVDRAYRNIYEAVDRLKRVEGLERAEVWINMPGVPHEIVTTMECLPDLYDRNVVVVEDAAFELKHPRSKIGRFAKKNERGGNGADSVPQKTHDRPLIQTDEQEEELLRRKDVYVSADDENKTLGYILNPSSIEDVVRAWQKFPRYKQQIPFLYDPKTGAIMFPEVPVSGTHAGVCQALFNVPQRASRSADDTANRVRSERFSDRLVHLYIKTDSNLEPKSIAGDVGYAGVANVNDPDGKERAYDNIYKALDRLSSIGMSADTPVNILDYGLKGFSLNTTIKEAMADFNVLVVRTGSVAIVEGEEFEAKHPRSKIGRFAKKNERAGTVGPENYDTVVQGALPHLEGYGPYCSGHTLGDSYPGVEELKWTERYDGLRGWYVSWKNIIDVYGDNPREYIDNLPENLLAVFESGDPEDDESDGGVWFTDVGDRDKFHTGRSTGLVDHSSEFYKEIAEENRTGIDEWAYGRGDRWVNTPRNTCSELVAQAMDTYVEMADLSINIGVRTLLKVLDSGEFENQHSVRDSGGCYNPDLRRWLEDRNFGIAEQYYKDVGVVNTPDGDIFVNVDAKAGPERYPIYGHFEIPYEVILHPPDYLPKSDVLDAARTYFARQEYFSRFYGDIQVILKTSVKDRTTFTVGDSLDNRDFVVPSEVGNAGVESMSLCREVGRGGEPTSIEESVRNLDIESVLANPLLIGESDDNERRSYVEAQIHGGVLLSDIKEVVVRLAPGEFVYGGDRTSTELVEKLNELEIPYRVVTTTEPEFEDALRRVGADDHFISVFSY